jgi:Uma2 family endonuclease
MSDSDRYELVNGRLVEQTMSMWSGYVAGKLFALLQGYCDAQKLGWVLPEGASYRCFRDPDRVRFRCRIADLFSMPAGVASEFGNGRKSAAEG